jgi:predicted transcriptional regulator
MATLSITQVYLDRAQKKALQQLANARGTAMSEEIRNAITAYLEGVSMEELRLLDEGTRRAAEDFEDMRATLKATNAKLDKVFAQIERMRAASRR